MIWLTEEVSEVGGLEAVAIAEIVRGRSASFMGGEIAGGDVPACTRIAPSPFSRLIDVTVVLDSVSLAWRT